MQQTLKQQVEAVIQQVEAVIQQQSELRSEAARCWNLALVTACDARLAEFYAFLQTL